LYLPKEIKVKKNFQKKKIAKKVCPRGTPNKPTVPTSTDFCSDFPNNSYWKRNIKQTTL
jgi:hypothetical protein